MTQLQLNIIYLQTMVIAENEVNIRNIMVKKMKRKLFCIIFASFPILKYKVPISNAIQVWMIKRIRANERSRRKQRIVRIVSRYHWRQNDVAYDSLRPAQHFLLLTGMDIIFGFFHEDDWIAGLETDASGAFENTGARPGAYTGVTRPSSIIFAAKRKRNKQNFSD